MNPDSITVAVLFALSFSFLLFFVFYSRFSLTFKLSLIFIAFFLFILSYNLIDEMLGKPRITKLEFVEGDRFIYIAHDCIEPNKIENTLGKMFVIYRKEEGDNFNVVPEISEFPYDRRYCEAFSDAEKYQIYKFEKVDTEELDDLNETGLEEKLKEGNKYYSVDDEWILELIDPPITRLPAKD